MKYREEFSIYLRSIIVLGQDQGPLPCPMVCAKQVSIGGVLYQAMDSLSGASAKHIDGEELRNQRNFILGESCWHIYDIALTDVENRLQKSLPQSRNYALDDLRPMDVVIRIFVAAGTTSAVVVVVAVGRVQV